ncbi:MAG: STAS domain-containing protein [Chromatiales bacterium]|nr:STAS domain-containing protein [Chromatiales bacterium]
MTIDSTYCDKKRLFSISAGSSFDFSNVAKFKTACENLPIEAEHIELDMNNVRHIDSTALGMMLLMRELVRERNLTINIINTHKSVNDALNMAHFNRLFNIA